MVFQSTCRLLCSVFGELILKLVGHDFFEPQPDNKAVAFVMKNILHNWGDSYNLRILTNLRAVASPDTKLLIVGAIIPYLCEPENDSGSQSLLPEYTLGGEGLFIFDMVVCVGLDLRKNILILVV